MSYSVAKKHIDSLIGIYQQNPETNFIDLSSKYLHPSSLSNLTPNPFSHLSNIQWTLAFRMYNEIEKCSLRRSKRIIWVNWASGWFYEWANSTTQMNSAMNRIKSESTHCKSIWVSIRQFNAASALFTIWHMRNQFELKSADEFQIDKEIWD